MSFDEKNEAPRVLLFFSRIWKSIKHLIMGYQGLTYYNYNWVFLSSQYSLFGLLVVSPLFCLYYGELCLALRPDGIYPVMLWTYSHFLFRPLLLGAYLTSWLPRDVNRMNYSGFHVHHFRSVPRHLKIMVPMGNRSEILRESWLIIHGKYRNWYQNKVM